MSGFYQSFSKASPTKEAERALFFACVCRGQSTITETFIQINKLPLSFSMHTSRAIATNTNGTVGSDRGLEMRTGLFPHSQNSLQISDSNSEELL